MATRNGASFQCARRRNSTTYPKLTEEGGRARLVVLAAEVGGRFSEETASFVHELAKAKSRGQPLMLQGRVRAHSPGAGKAFSRARQQSLSQEWIRPRCTRCCGISCTREVQSHLVGFCIEISWMFFLPNFRLKKNGTNSYANLLR